MNNPQNRQPDKTRSRIILVSIAVMFVAPLLGAIWLYKHVQDGGDVWGTTNHGELIQPARPLDPFELSDVEGNAVTLDTLHEQWTLLFLPTSPCDDTCKKNIYHMRQVWAALGREAPRVQRWLLIEDDAQHAALSEFLEQYPRMSVVVDGNRELIGPVRRSIDPDEPAIYLVDPLGNLMMAFPQSLDPRNMLKDLKKLLKISKIG